MGNDKVTTQPTRLWPPELAPGLFDVHDCLDFGLRSKLRETKREQALALQRAETPVDIKKCALVSVNSWWAEPTVQESPRSKGLRLTLPRPLDRAIPGLEDFQVGHGSADRPSRLV